jgi:hypothetical protein
VPSLRGNNVVALLLAADDTAEPTKGADASTNPRLTVAVANRFIGLPFRFLLCSCRARIQAELTPRLFVVGNFD